MSGLSTPKLLDWLETRAKANMETSDKLLEEARHLRNHLPHSIDPWAESARIQECEALAGQHLLFAVGLREEARRLQAARRMIGKPDADADSDS